MARLTDEHRHFIVERLALFDSPTTVVKALEAEFTITVPRQQVAVFDPTKYPDRRKARRAKKWEPVFHATRERFLKSVNDVPIANRVVRMRRLQRIADDAQEMRNLQLERETIEQAAKEMGDYFTNHRVLSGPGGGPIPIEGYLQQLPAAGPDADAARAAEQHAAAAQSTSRASVEDDE